MKINGFKEVIHLVFPKASAEGMNQMSPVTPFLLLLVAL
jgi:hypothetical protein